MKRPSLEIRSSFFCRLFDRLLRLTTCNQRISLGWHAALHSHRFFRPLRCVHLSRSGNALRENIAPRRGGISSSGLRSVQILRSIFQENPQESVSSISSRPFPPSFGEATPVARAIFVSGPPPCQPSRVAPSGIVLRQTLLEDWTKQAIGYLETT